MTHDAAVMHLLSILLLGVKFRTRICSSLFHGLWHSLSLAGWNSSQIGQFSYFNINMPSQSVLFDTAISASVAANYYAIGYSRFVDFFTHNYCFDMAARIPVLLPEGRSDYLRPRFFPTASSRAVLAGNVCYLQKSSPLDTQAHLNGQYTDDVCATS